MALPDVNTLSRLLLFLVIPLPVFAGVDATSNAVNERIPVRKAEMEAYWQVDCSASWARLLELPAQQNCSLPAGLLEQLKLCSFIYQVPGEEPAYSGPNYRAALNPGEGCRSKNRPDK